MDHLPSSLARIVAALSLTGLLRALMAGLTKSSRHTAAMELMAEDKELEQNSRTSNWSDLGFPAPIYY